MSAPLVRVTVKPFFVVPFIFAAPPGTLVDVASAFARSVLVNVLANVLVIVVVCALAVITVV
jgi:hypothetical protein